MSNINFLPIEYKEKVFLKKKVVLNLTIGLLVCANIFLSINSFSKQYKIYSSSKEVFSQRDKLTDVNIEKPNIKALNFFEKNIYGNFNYEAVTINCDKLIVRFIINDNNDFANCVNKIESMKNCQIEYLVAPYKENNTYKFEMNIEVS